jgi:hypothetical protein
MIVIAGNDKLKNGDVVKVLGQNNTSEQKAQQKSGTGGGQQ